MKGTDLSAAQLIAPCGINCGVCYAFLRDKNKCFGCRCEDPIKANHCQVCKIKNCEYLLQTGSKFCYDCSSYPCKRMKQLDQRYRLKYEMSNLENLRQVKKLGLDSFIQLELVKWKCSECSGVVCVHKGYCLDCERKKP
jgi:hypothetical protein